VTPMGNFGGFMSGPMLVNPFCCPEVSDSVPAVTTWGELRGWRVWNLMATENGPRLSSVSFEAQWPHARMTSADGIYNSSEANTKANHGYHAYKTRRGCIGGMTGNIPCRMSWKLRRWSPYPVMGEVELYGQVLELEYGYHAECCRIVSLEPLNDKALQPVDLYSLWRHGIKRHKRRRVIDQLRDHYLKEE